MDFYSFERLNHSNVAFGMSHANSIDFNIGSQYNGISLMEISYSWIREHFSDPPPFFYLDHLPRLLIFRLSVGPRPLPLSYYLRLESSII